MKTFALIWFLGLVPALALGPFWGPALFQRFEEWRTRKSFEAANLLAETVMALIHEYPHEWRVSSYDIEHPKTGMTIWIGNPFAGLPYLKIKVDGLELKPDHRHRRAIYRAYKGMAASLAVKRVHDSLARVRDRLRVYEGGKR